MAKLSRTAEFYRKNPKARKKRLKQQAELNKTPKEKKRRVELNKLNKKHKSKVGDSLDVSHKKGGGTTLEAQSKNRSRNGENGKSTKK